MVSYIDPTHRKYSQFKRVYKKMRPSTTEAIRSVAESPQYCCCPQSDIGSVRSQDLVFMCGAEVTTTVPRSTPSTSGDENFDLLDYTPQAQCPSPEVASDGSGGVNPCTRGEITLVRRPSKLSLGGLSLSASGRSHSFAFSPDLRRRPESSHRQRSQSDVIHMATLAAREMRRTMVRTLYRACISRTHTEDCTVYCVLQLSSMSPIT